MDGELDSSIFIMSLWIAKLKQIKMKKRKKEKEKRPLDKTTKEGFTKPPPSSSSSSSASSSSSSNEGEVDESSAPSDITTLCEKKRDTESSGTGPSIQIMDKHHLQVRTASGACYKTDRFCPHKHVDLASRVSLHGMVL